MKDVKKFSSEIGFISIFFVFSVIFEIVSMLTISQGQIILPKYFLFDLTFCLIICAIMYLIKNKIFNNVITILFLTLQVVMNILNAALYKTFGYIFSWDMFNLGMEGVKAFDPQFINWYSVVINILLLALVIFLVVYVDKRFETKKLFHRYSSILVAFLVFFALQTTGLTTLLVAQSTLADVEASNDLYIAQSDAYLYDNMFFTVEAYKKFGTFGFYLKSLGDTIFANAELTAEEQQEYQTYLQDGEVLANDTATHKDQNLIVIMLESFEWYAIDPYNTPTLYDLMENKAVSFTQFYARNKTNYSEGIGILGNMPKSTTLSNLNAKGILDPEYSLPNLFIEQNYDEVNYFHSYTKKFYERNTINKNLGFENVYGLEDADVPNKSYTFGNWAGDYNYMTSMVDKIAPKDKKFFSFFTTVSTHGPYEKENKNLKSINGEDLYATYDANYENVKTYLTEQGFYIPSSDIQMRLRKYKVAAMDTDRMLKYLLDYLEINGLKDNTTLVLYADHNCYYNDISSHLKFGTRDIDAYASGVFRVPFMIYSPLLTAQKVDTFCSTYDVYPTICDLFGLRNNNNMKQGYSVFGTETDKSIFISYISGIFTNKLYSTNIMDIYDFNNLSVSDADKFDFQLKAVNFYEKQEKIDTIYLNNLKTH